ncbi:hypothetical protein FRB98_004996 [Tulasnella sp. 332]|nr:hypothetical protein FRB98_004996 [Tulasnella sp. 332]
MPSRQPPQIRLYTSQLRDALRRRPQDGDDILSIALSLIAGCDEIITSGDAILFKEVLNSNAIEEIINAMPDIIRADGSAEIPVKAIDCVGRAMVFGESRLTFLDYPDRVILFMRQVRLRAAHLIANCWSHYNHLAAEWMDSGRLLQRRNVALRDLLMIHVIFAERINAVDVSFNIKESVSGTEDENLVTGLVGLRAVLQARPDVLSKRLYNLLVTVFIFADDFWERLEALLRLNPAALAPHLRRDYLHVLDYLRALPRNEVVTSSIATWESFTEIGGFTEVELREEAEAERKRAMGDAKGCAWYKCAVFGLEFPGASYLRCAACLDTHYCGLLCQRRDWESGGHDVLCGKIQQRRQEPR